VIIRKVYSRPVDVVTQFPTAFENSISRRPAALYGAAVDRRTDTPIGRGVFMEGREFSIAPEQPHPRPAAPLAEAPPGRPKRAAPRLRPAGRFGEPSGQPPPALGVAAGAR
jgi:hypothetical protein